MRILSLAATNFRPFATLQEVHLGQFTTIVGQNDAGKSNILRALRFFFEERPKIDECDVYDMAGPDEDIVIEVAFTDLPEKIELEDGIETTLQDEMLVDANSCLRITKVYPRKNLAKFKVSLITKDFQDDSFSGLPALKESELNERCANEGIEVTKSGRGITNKNKREDLRAVAKVRNVGIGLRELHLAANDGVWKHINHLLPEFVLFESDTRLGVGETTFRSQFRLIVKAAVEQQERLMI